MRRARVFALARSLSLPRGFAASLRETATPSPALRYTATGWLEKNKDTLNEDLSELVKASSNALLAQVFVEPKPAEGGGTDAAAAGGGGGGGAAARRGGSASRP